MRSKDDRNLNDSSNKVSHSLCITPSSPGTEVVVSALGSAACSTESKRRGLTGESNEIRLCEVIAGDGALAGGCDLLEN